jgi:protein-S-isoprenylcysteine O-methyltransferase Ste14
MTPTVLSRVFVVLRGLVYSAAFVASWAWLAVAVRPFDSRIALRPAPWVAPFGVAVAIAGGLVAALCIAVFLTSGRGTPAPFDPPREFVATGPYRYVRNPMYLGGGAVLLGAGLAVSSASIVALSVVFFVITHLFVVLYEEPTLTRTFGDSYARYRSTVHRWLPRRIRTVAVGGLAIAGALVSVAAAQAAPAIPGALVIWPGYSVELPRDHCVDVHKGPDFDVLYVRQREAKTDDFLLAIYAGYAPHFAPECARPTSRKWTASGLSFESVRGAEGCAEFLIHDATSTERGLLHIWFGPGSAEHAQTAERLLASVRPVPLPVKDATSPPACPATSPAPK